MSNACSVTVVEMETGNVVHYQESQCIGSGTFCDSPELVIGAFDATNQYMVANQRALVPCSEATIFQSEDVFRYFVEDLQTKCAVLEITFKKGEAN